MKILMLANKDMVLYKFRAELIEELLKEHQVFICLPEGEYIQELEEMGCKFILCEMDRHGKNPLKELQLVSKYKKIIKKCNPDIVFTYTIKPNVYGGMVCAKMNIPYVVNITGLGTAVENQGIMQKFTLLLYRYALRKAKKVFFQNTENLKFMLQKHVVQGRYDLIPGSGVNLDRFSLLDYPKEDSIEFVFIARIMKEKGIDQYLDAAEYIRRQYPNTVFHICGFCEQAYDERLTELNERNIIVYHGLVRDVREILKNVHCTVHPSFYPEGISNALLESSACGRPIITTNRSGCREVIDDEKNGYIVKQQDSRDLIEKIEKFIALSWEEKRQMGLYGRHKVEEEFDRQIVVERYMAELECVEEKEL